MDRSELILLVCRAGEQACGIPVGHVHEICRPLRLEAAPGAPAGVSGIAMLRGQATPVLDLGWVLSGRPLDSARRWIRLRVGERAVALAASAVSGLRAVPAADFQALPPVLSGSGARQSYALLDRELVAVLDASRAVPPELWRIAGGAGA